MIFFVDAEMTYISMGLSFYRLMIAGLYEDCSKNWLDAVPLPLYCIGLG
jgi:hypothetical protein